MTLPGWMVDLEEEWYLFWRDRTWETVPQWCTDPEAERVLRTWEKAKTDFDRALARGSVNASSLGEAYMAAAEDLHDFRDHLRGTA